MCRQQPSAQPLGCTILQEFLVPVLLNRGQMCVMVNVHFYRVMTSRQDHLRRAGWKRRAVGRAGASLFDLCHARFGVLDAVGRGAHLRLAAKHRPFAAPQHNPAAVVRAKIEQRERVTGSRGLGGLPTSQPPQLVLNGVSRGAEFGGDPAEPETLRLQDQQPLDRDRGPRKPGLQRASNTTLSHERTRVHISTGQAWASPLRCGTVRKP